LHVYGLVEVVLLSEEHLSSLLVYDVPKLGSLLQVLMILCFEMLVEDVHGVNQVLLNCFNLGIHTLDEYIHRDFDFLHRLCECVNHLRRIANTLIRVVLRLSF
jgi:hypothetical protein